MEVFVIYPIKFLFILILSLILLTGCLQSKIIEEHAIINSYGIDVLEDKNQIEATTISYVFNSQNEQKNVTESNSGIGTTIRDAYLDAERNSSLNFLPGQIRLVVYGKDTAEIGIAPFFTLLVRDTQMPNMMFSAVSTTTAKQLLLEAEQLIDIDIGRYLQELVAKEIKEDSIPDVSLQQITHIYEDPGMDLLLPLIGIKEEGKVGLTAMALFQSDKYVGDITVDDAFLVNLFQKHIKDKPFNISISKEPFIEKLEGYENNEFISDQLHTSLLITEGHSKTKLTNKEQQTFQTDMNLKMNLYETSEYLNVEDEEIVENLEREIEREIKKQYERLLSDVQELNADPFGLGNIYQSNNGGNLTEEEWRQKFPEVNVDFNIRVEIVNFGTIQ